MTSISLLKNSLKTFSERQTGRERDRERQGLKDSSSLGQQRWQPKQPSWIFYKLSLVCLPSRTPCSGLATYLATRLPARSYIQFVATAKRKKQKREKEAENLALKLPLRLQNGCLALMATSAPAGGNKQRTCSITRTTTAAAAGWPCALCCVSAFGQDGWPNI